MHFHLPKPLHGWREFAGEIAIIVVGVLIALSAEQVVEAAHWHQKVGIVRKSLMGELGNDRARWQSNMADARCSLRDIGELDRWVQSGASGSPPPAASDFAHRGFFWMHSANWNLAASSDTLDHFPIDEQLAFAALYDGVTHRQVDIEKAGDLFSRVNSLIPLATDDQSRRDLRIALGSLTLKIGSLTHNDNYMTRHFDALGVTPDDADISAELANQHCTAGETAT